MKTRHLLLLVITSGLIFSIVLLTTSTNNSWADYFFNRNTLELIDNGVVDKSKISITLVTEYNPPFLIVDKGKVNQIPEVYGANNWCLSYNDSIYCVGGHRKFNRKNDHDYKITFFKKENSIYCEFDSKGVDGDTYTLKLEEQCNQKSCCKLYNKD